MKPVLSRRRLLQSAALVPLSRFAKAAGAPVLVYVGTYSSPQGPEGSKGRGGGICLFEMDSSKGTLIQREVFEDGLNPSWLAFHPSERYLYAANEISNFEGANSGAVTAYAADAASGRLAKLNTVSSQGAGPAHLSVHPSGKFVFVANYHGGTFAVLPVLPDGRLGAATDVKRDTGPTGPLQAVSAPKGSFAISGHDRTHAHMIESDPTGRFVLGSDLGMDRIHVWQLNVNAGALEPVPGSPVVIPPGDGPRHFVFHTTGRWMYSLQEEGSTIIQFAYDSATGSLTQTRQISSLPAGFAGTNFTSEIRISRDARFLYVANRLHDSIAWFTIANDGRLTFAGETWTRGDYPRSFTIDPSGNFLYCCNQRADAVTCFRVNRDTGELNFTGEYVPVGTPSIIVFKKAAPA